MMDYVPNFELMENMVRLHIAEGEFSDKLMSKIIEAEDQYSTGQADFEKAKQIIYNL